MDAVEITLQQCVDAYNPHQNRDLYWRKVDRYLQIQIEAGRITRDDARAIRETLELEFGGGDIVPK